MSSPRRDWHFITCEYPPDVGGVADYTESIASALALAGEIVHVWCPGASGDHASHGIVVHRRLGAFSPADCVRAGRALNAHGNRRLLVQWVPHGYGYKSLNVPFAIWLAWRAWVRGDDLQLMVHEPYMRVTWPPAHLAASLIERLMLWLVGTASSRTWLSTPSWLPYVRPYVRRRTAVEWLPVPAPLPGNTPVGSSVDGTRQSTPVVGHFSTHSPVVTGILAPSLERILGESDARVVLMGRDSDRFREAFVHRNPALADRVLATGVIGTGDVVARMRQCDLMLQPYPDGITTRNTSMLLALASGVCVVSNTGPLTEPLWDSSPSAALARGVDAERLAELTLEMLKAPARRRATAEAGARLYRERFDVSHALDMLIASVRADTPTASVPTHVQA